MNFLIKASHKAFLYRYLQNKKNKKKKNHSAYISDYMIIHTLPKVVPRLEIYWVKAKM